MNAIPVVRGFWQDAKKVGREYTILSISPNAIRDNKQNRDNQQSLPSIFSEMPFIRPMSRRGQLDAMMQYVKMNPQRLATKRLKPGFFRVQAGIEIAGRTYSGIGNTKLLLAPKQTFSGPLRSRCRRPSTHPQSMGVRPR